VALRGADPPPTEAVMAGRSGTPKVVCGEPLRDGSACKAVASNAFGGRCEHHGVVAVGEALGWRVRGSRRAGVYVADQGARVLVADTAPELLTRLKARPKDVMSAAGDRGADRLRVCVLRAVQAELEQKGAVVSPLPGAEHVKSGKGGAVTLSDGVHDEERGQRLENRRAGWVGPRARCHRGRLTPQPSEGSQVSVEGPRPHARPLGRRRRTVRGGGRSRATAVEPLNFDIRWPSRRSSGER
jgi:hypothetical protein